MMHSNEKRRSAACLPSSTLGSDEQRHSQYGNALPRLTLLPKKSLILNESIHFASLSFLLWYSVKFSHVLYWQGILTANSRREKRILRSAFSNSGPQRLLPVTYQDSISPQSTALPAIHANSQLGPTKVPSSVGDDHSIERDALLTIARVTH
ncbi:uncharacterized protein FOMMEDRAFT_160524 [Fomitiporia mediterranea MF3/22]|uniref:uncharacterized protein n=1 Tax=Fomitiporia mediterranea (strain MF3/22) TaxID=694068 RepID=UPI0004409970|nr:uncharacterized protein FOMMEDRAFT_160524 [Fomitiporia mediterranea MF3/22]EJC99469.1 hypothetical protein FOMMEDRAFT_160524 [Fomitiporia mediterranea MF3/22]